MEQIIIENGGEQGIKNYSAIVAAVRERTDTYKGLIVSEEAVPQAKAEVADLRKMAKRASDLRIAIKKEHEAKIAQTVEQLKEITELYTGAADSIDRQVKEYEKKAQDEKRAAITEHFNSRIGKLEQFLTLSTLWNEKWLNKGYALDTVFDEIDKAIENAVTGMRAILSMQSPHEQTLLRTFFSTLDMGKVMSEKEALDAQLAEMLQMQEMREEAKAREEAERKAAEIAAQKPQESVSEGQGQTPAPKTENPVEDDFKQYSLTFTVTGTRKQILSVRDFMLANGIAYRKGA